MSVSRMSPAPEDVVRRYVERVRAELEPDPLFRRRLRGDVTNRFVASREGLVEPAARSSRMGRVGRACLYASFALSMSVGGALAASRGAVPGDLLYPLKLQVEAIRLETFPEAFRDDLLVYALSERMAEFGRLTEEGDLDGAAGLAETIAAGYHELAGLGIAIEAPELRSSLEVLDALSDRLPAPAQAAIERAITEGPPPAGAAPARAPVTLPPQSASGASGQRPALVPVDQRGAPHVDRSATVAPAALPSNAASPRASERPARGMLPAADDEAAGTDEAAPTE